VSCRHHLYLSVNERTGHIKSHFTKADLNADIAEEQDGEDAYGLDAVKETCSLDVADKGAHTQSTVARTINMSQKSADLIEQRALLKVRKRMRV
jgi:transcriptional regulator